MGNLPEKTAGPHARATGVVYLLYFLTAVSAQKFPQTSGTYIALNLISCGFYLALTVLFYYLFRPVNKAISLIAAFLSSLGCIATVLYIFKMDALAVNPLFFFGPYCILIGYLVYQSDFLPRFLGILMIVAGIGWLVFLSPLEKQLSLYIKITGIVAEALLMFWLIIKGVKTEKWKARHPS